MASNNNSTHEVIEISDGSEGEDSLQETEPLAWSAVVARLLALAKDRELLDESTEITRLLREIRVPPSLAVHGALLRACEELGTLLEMAGDRPRRYRASAALAVVLCEVLSLAQAPYDEMKMEQEVDLTDPVQELLGLMKRWQRLLAEVLTAGEGKANAVGRTMSRLEDLMAACDRELESIDANIDIHVTGKQAIAEEWVHVLSQCQEGLSKLQLGPGETGVLLMDNAFDKTENVRDQFQTHCQASAALKRQKWEMSARRSFFNAAHTLACTVVGQDHARRQCQTEEQCDHSTKLEFPLLDDKLALLSNDMMQYLDVYCDNLLALVTPEYPWHASSPESVTPFTEREEAEGAALNGIEHRAMLSSFAKQFELFWLVYRDQLPPAVVDVVARSFNKVTKINTQTQCPVTQAVARISQELQASLAMK